MVLMRRREEKKCLYRVCTFVETQTLTRLWPLVVFVWYFFFLQKGKEEDTQELDSKDCFFDRSIFHLNDEELEENNPPDFPVVHVEVVQMENKSI